MLETLALTIGILVIGITLFLAYRYYRNHYRKNSTNLEEVLEESGKKYLAKVGSVGLVIGVFRDDKIYIRGFGETHREGDEIPDEKTLFEIASITKVFTTSTAQILVDRNEISWEDTIERTFEEELEACEKCRKISLRHLASHTSGLPRFPKSFFHRVKDQLNPYKNLKEQDIFDYLTTCAENSDLGSYSYSNLGLGVLGQILAREIGGSYESIVIREIAAKLGMNDTGVTLSEEQQSRLAQGYNKDGEPNPLWENKVLAGAGSLISTAEDMIKFIKANIDSNESDISKSLIKTHKKEKNGNTGLGWHYHSSFLSFMTGEGDVIWHNGATGGYSSFIAINRKTRSGVVLLSNSRNDVTHLGMRLSMLARDISFARD